MFFTIKKRKNITYKIRHFIIIIIDNYLRRKKLKKKLVGLSVPPWTIGCVWTSRWSGGHNSGRCYDVVVQSAWLLVDHVWPRRDVWMWRADRWRPVRCRRRQHYSGKFQRRPQGVRCACHIVVRSVLLTFWPVGRSANGKSYLTGVHWKINQVSTVWKLLFIINCVRRTNAVFTFYLLHSTWRNS